MQPRVASKSRVDPSARDTALRADSTWRGTLLVAVASDAGAAALESTATDVTHLLARHAVVRLIEWRVEAEMIAMAQGDATGSG